MMSRYIDADKLVKFYEVAMNDEWNKKTAPSSWTDAYDNVIADIEDNIPTADVVEVKHGKWTSIGLMNPQCSLCHKYNYEESRFCPNCGTKMDLEEGAQE